MSLILTASVPIFLLLSPLAMRASLTSGLRGLFTGAVGALYLVTWNIAWVIDGGHGPRLMALGGYLVLGWLLIVGSYGQVMLHHEEEFRRFRREAPIFRSFGRSPRLLPPFSIDPRWLLTGVVIAAIGIVYAILRPESYLFAWAQSLLGAAMIVASTGAFSPGASGDEGRSPTTNP